MKNEYIKSPINYTGSKWRMLNVLIPMFPQDIDTFYDLFGGAGNVGINVKANKIVYNEIINFIPQLFNCWQKKSKEDINSYIDKTIFEYKLSSKDKQSFEKFRNHYNKYKNIEDLFILLCYSFNYQIRFNNKHEYNSSFGKEASTMNQNIRKNLDVFIDFIHNTNISFFNSDYKKLNVKILKENDFVYLDPPYSLSKGVYQDGKRGFNGWDKNDDMYLMEFCDKLNEKGIKFGISNVFTSKGISNQELIEWSRKYNVTHIKKSYNNANYQRKTREPDDEVYIYNYEKKKG